MASRLAQKPKYFISSYEGKADPRWLPGQDGQKILPQAPDTEFRYLGAYISLCLISKKQIQMINNTIMNWRWRALAQKIDPAMLANTVTEYLLPKIELGLLFAYGISDQMCRSWTRTIIDTLAVTANMTDDNKINECRGDLLPCRNSGHWSSNANFENH
jgi:hypothetical protein